MKKQKRNLGLKLLTGFITFILVFLISSVSIYAQEGLPPNPTDPDFIGPPEGKFEPGALIEGEPEKPKESKPIQTFDVSKYLKIEGGQSYLEDKPFSAGIDDPSLQTGVYGFIIRFIEVLTRIIASFAMLFIIIGGLMMMLSAGKDERRDQGKTIITYAVIGLVVAFLSLIIVSYVQSLFFTA